MPTDRSRRSFVELPAFSVCSHSDTVISVSAVPFERPELVLGNATLTLNVDGTAKSQSNEVNKLNKPPQIHCSSRHLLLEHGRVLVNPEQRTVFLALNIPSTSRNLTWHGSCLTERLLISGSGSSTLTLGANVLPFGTECNVSSFCGL